MKINVLRGFIKKEILQIFRDKKMVAVLFIVPVMQTILFGLALTNEVKNIKLAVIFEPSDYLAQKTRQKALNSGWFKSVDIDETDFLQADKAIASKKAEAVLIASGGNFEEAVEKQRPFQLLIDATNAMRAKQIENYVKAVLISAIKEKRPYLLSKNLIEIDERIMFNHSFDTPSFMLPAITTMASFFVTMLICAMAITKEKERGTMEKLIVSPATALEIILGKTSAYMLIGCFLICFITFVGIVFFGVPLRGHLWQIVLTGILFVWSALSIAVFVSTSSKSQQQAMMGCFIVIFPAMLLSGILFPIENIPQSLRWICYFNPLMYAAQNFRDIMLKGGDLTLFWKYCLILFALSLSISAISVKKFNIFETR